jgi:hypothetical protein
MSSRPANGCGRKTLHYAVANDDDTNEVREAGKLEPEAPLGVGSTHCLRFLLWNHQQDILEERRVATALVISTVDFVPSE